MFLRISENIYNRQGPNQFLFNDSECAFTCFEGTNTATSGNNAPIAVVLIGGTGRAITYTQEANIHSERWLLVKSQLSVDSLCIQNLKRVAEVWMDEYAEYVYQRRPEYRHLSAGDMTPQKELRSRLGCKNFKWFMSNVAWDLPKHYPPVEPPAAAWGEVQLILTAIRLNQLATLA